MDIVGIVWVCLLAAYFGFLAGGIWEEGRQIKRQEFDRYSLDHTGTGLTIGNLLRGSRRDTNQDNEHDIGYR